jgi:hypothetical protein
MPRVLRHRQEFTMHIKLIAVTALAGFAAFGAHAFQGEANNLQPQPFQSMRSRADVRAEALKPVQITNGGTGVAKPTGMGDRDAVRAGARTISKEGAALYGT